MDKPMTSEARKQAWAAAHTLVQYEFCATYAWWLFRGRNERQLWLWVAENRTWVTSMRSTRINSSRYPDLHGIARPLLKLVPPEQYARAVAMQLTATALPI